MNVFGVPIEKGNIIYLRTVTGINANVKVTSTHGNKMVVKSMSNPPVQRTVYIQDIISVNLLRKR